MDDLVTYFYSDGCLELMICKMLVFMLVMMFCGIIFGCIKGLMTR
jgi:hypothetical protein